MPQRRPSSVAWRVVQLHAHAADSTTPALIMRLGLAQPVMLLLLLTAVLTALLSLMLPATLRRHCSVQSRARCWHRACVNRTACLVESISKFKWRVAAGEAVAHFLAANGPPEIVSYNWNKVASWSCPVAVCREPVVPSGQRFAHHDFADLLRLTSLGARELRKPEEKQSLIYRLELACSGASHGLSKHTFDPTNCARVCCGAPGSMCTCKQKRHQACSVRVLITATPALVRQGRFEIELKGSHVPNGVQPVPPPLNGLRIDPSLQRQLVNLCKSSKQTPTTAIADLVPELKLAQKAFITPIAAEGTIGGEANDVPALNNTRFNPRPSVVAGALKRFRRELRGPAAIGDWERVNKLVREQLIQHGHVSSPTPLLTLPARFC